MKILWNSEADCSEYFQNNFRDNGKNTLKINTLKQCTVRNKNYMQCIYAFNYIINIIILQNSLWIKVN